MPTIVGILTFIGMINTYKSLKRRQRGDRAAYQLQMYVGFRYCGVLCQVRIEWGGGGTGAPDPPEKSQKLGFLSNTGPDPLKNHKATEPAFNAGPEISTPVKRHLNDLTAADR